MTMKSWFMDIKVDARTVIVFDLDDTLYNEMEYLRSAYSEIAKSVDFDNWRPLFARMYSLFRSKADVFEFVSTTYEVDKLEVSNTYPHATPFRWRIGNYGPDKSQKGKNRNHQRWKKDHATRQIKGFGHYRPG